MAAAMVSKMMEFITRRRENLVSALLLGSFVVLGVRSAQQQSEIEALEAEKLALRAANHSMSTAMWSWRQTLFQLADDDRTAAASIPLARLRAIYGEPDRAEAAAGDPLPGAGEDAVQESITIA